MVEAEEIKEQLRAVYRPEADLSERRERVTRALEVTERQYALIGQKIDGLLEMRSHLEGKLKKYRGWLEQID